MNEHTTLELSVYGERLDLTAMIKDLNHMCGTHVRPDLAQLQAIRDTLEQVRYHLLTNTPFDFTVTQ